ncbi:MAG: hypothetical protein WC492_02635 [Candidatus Micrarchaeia archaeon]
MNFQANQNTLPKSNSGQKSVFQVICPKVKGAKLYDLFPKVNEIATWVKKQSKENNMVYETVILFSEMAIDPGAHPEQHSVVVGTCNLMSPYSLPREPWFSVAFNIFEEDKNGVIANIGYLVTHDDIFWRQKLTFTSYEKFVFVSYAIKSNLFGSDIVAREMISNNINQANKVRGENSDFLQIVTPSGIIVEHRICADVFREKSKTEPDILVVSSAGLEISEAANRFKTVLAHDGVQGMLTAGQKPRLISIKEESSFYVATLLDESIQ